MEEDAKSKPPRPPKNPVNKQKLARHRRGDGLPLRPGRTSIKNKTLLKKLRLREKAIERAAEQAARAELLLTEESGHLEADIGEHTTQYHQREIADNVDITSATKHFRLNLDFGAYRHKYTRNGRHLLLGGRMGHVAAFDWVTKRLSCEMNVMESVHDVSWLHLETMFAVAQKNWVHIYDNQGIEIHCLKRMNGVTRLEFLPYHFLLASGSYEGCLTWLDVSIGQIISRYDSKLGRIGVMTQNPSNAVLCVGNSKGVVSMWAPKSKDPLAKMLCHRQGISSIAVHPHGTYMATSCPDRTVKTWDVRQLSGPVHDFVLRSAVDNLVYSQKGLLAASSGNCIEVFRDAGDTMKPYIRHKETWGVSSLQFCPFEDVLGVSTAKGFVSVLVPGSGEPNFDALEVNPFQTKSQRREAEVKALLDKIQPELITLDPGAVAEVDVPTLKEKVEAKKKLLFIKPQAIDFKPRRTKAKGKGGTAKVVKTKKILKELKRKEAAEAIRQVSEEKAKKKKRENTRDFGALNRFLPKSK
ncbi:WD repeat-containing protein 46 [Diachasma alloeum]|uniref:WD repeat-containing protein 46 n=1 Tax=Diachasma alloeum TaxID=454923 RepID=UPI00073842D5|nr:WD repeat-containing protein 46 [Diachasma alloeum]